MASSQARSIGGVTRLGEFWEEERQRNAVTSQTEKQDENVALCLCLAIWLSIDKKYGLIKVVRAS